MTGFVRSNYPGGLELAVADDGPLAVSPQGGVISPLLANIYLHVLDTELSRRKVGEFGALRR